MTPAEMRELLLEEARWWANQPAHSGRTAQRWVAFFEQLPDDDRMLVGLSDGFDPNAFRFRNRVDLATPAFSAWNMFCNILQKLSQEPAIPRPSSAPATLRRRYSPPSRLRDKP
jgi:hypothetical protein